MKGLAHQVRRFTVSLRHDYAQEIAKDPHSFRRRVAGMVRRGLPSGRPGRPKHDAITRAVKLRAQNKPWCEVYKECIPGLSKLSRGNRN